MEKFEILPIYKNLFFNFSGVGSEVGSGVSWVVSWVVVVPGVLNFTNGEGPWSAPGRAAWSKFWVVVRFLSSSFWISSRILRIMREGLVG